MNKYLLILSFFWIGALSAQETGIRFETGNFSQALEKAKLEGKYLFIDSYTTWCGPCKKLEKDVFTDKEVANYFNSKFINLRLDIEKGEGPELKKRFGVHFIPTLLFINSEGEVENKFIGSSTKEEFMKLSAEVFTKDNRYGDIQRKFKGGDRSIGFMSLYMNELLAQKEYANAKELLYSLIKSEPAEKLCTKDFWPVLTQDFLAEHGSGVYNFLIINRDLLCKNIGEKEYKDKMSPIFIKFSKVWVSNVKLKIQKEDFDKLRKEIKLLSLEDKDEVLYILRIAEARQNGKFDSYTSLLDKSSGKISEKNTYSLLMKSSFMAKEGTKGQCEKIAAMINKFIATANNNDYKSGLSNVLKSLDKKIKSE
ncbi:MAG: thioredoxin family protein [Prolixibacteraceae bacterium]